MLVQECIVPKGARDPATHVVQPDRQRFPFGLANLSTYFHARGLRAGIYTDVAAETCAGYEGSGPSSADQIGHWAIDALTYAQWGFDMIEADFCHTDGQESAFEMYTRARDAIAAATAATGRQISFCKYWQHRSRWAGRPKGGMGHWMWAHCDK